MSHAHRFSYKSEIARSAGVIALVVTQDGLPLALGQLEQDYLTRPWTDVRDLVQVKLVGHDRELYGLPRSGARRDRGPVMPPRRVKKLIERVHELSQQR